MERSIPPPTTTKNWAAEAILTKVAPLSVSSSTGPERNVADIENPMVTSTASMAQARAVRGWRRAHSPPHGGAGTVSRPGWALIVGSWLGGCLDQRLGAVRADLALAAGLAGQPPLIGGTHDPHCRQLLERREPYVLPHRVRQNHALPLPVLGDKDDACPGCVSRPPETDRPSVAQHLAGFGRPDPTEG